MKNAILVILIILSVTSTKASPRLCSEIFNARGLFSQFSTLSFNSLSLEKAGQAAKEGLQNLIDLSKTPSHTKAYYELIASVDTEDLAIVSQLSKHFMRPASEIAKNYFKNLGLIYKQEFSHSNTDNYITMAVLVSSSPWFPHPTSSREYKELPDAPHGLRFITFKVYHSQLYSARDSVQVSLFAKQLAASLTEMQYAWTYNSQSSNLYPAENATQEQIDRYFNDNIHVE